MFHFKYFIKTQNLSHKTNVDFNIKLIRKRLNLCTFEHNTIKDNTYGHRTQRANTKTQGFTNKS
jgi:hypothetical protein